MDQARRARQRLIAGWAAGQGIGAVATGHTLDDQAETVLMRLARGSGVDGLSAMAPARRLAGVLWLRPLLAVRRTALRGLLAARGIVWAEDPTNADGRFARVRARAALAALAPLGITAEGLAATAARMGRARRALGLGAAELADRALRIEGGDIVMDAAALAAAPAELRDRLLAQALVWVAGAPYRPRQADLDRLGAALLAGRGGTLAGCRAWAAGGLWRIAREWRAVRDLAAAPGDPWDGRWRLTGPGTPGARVGALGPEGLADCPGWRATGLPRASLLASPAVRAGGVLVAAPLAGRSAGWRAELLRTAADFRAALIGD
jgi:tRNA(Ile)-lysidine synthase